MAELSWSRDGERLALRGDLNQEQLLALWDARIQATAGATSVDLSGVTWIDSAGLALLIHLVALIRRQGQQPVLTGKSDKLQTLIALYNLPANAIA